MISYIFLGDENVHEAILLEKEGKLLQHQDLKNKRKRIDIGKHYFLAFIWFSKSNIEYF